MNKELKVFFENMCKSLKNSPGSIDMVFTAGTSILSEKAVDWSDFGISNIAEIHLAIEEIKGMCKNHQTLQDLSKSSLDDLFATLQDIAYHSAIFGIYFFAIENYFQRNVSKSELSNKNTINTCGHEVNPSAYLQHSSMRGRNGAQLMESILYEVTQGSLAFECVFSSDITDYSCKLSCLYELQRSLLSLQFTACELKERWWTNRLSPWAS